MSMFLFSLLLGLPVIGVRWGVDSREGQDPRVAAEVHAIATIEFSVKNDEKSVSS
jgi:hypothetical protein